MLTPLRDVPFIWSKHQRLSEGSAPVFGLSSFRRFYATAYAAPLMLIV